MRKLFTIIIIFLAGIGCSSAQDIHFSQFQSAPLILNPSLTGAFAQDHRIIANYRNQWKSIANPYTTYAVSYDAGLFKGRLSGGFLGVGFSLYTDKAGDVKMGTTQGNVSVAYHLMLDRQNSLTAGLQGGFSQKSIDQTAMQWDNQYDPASPGGFNASLSSGETSTYGNFGYADFGAGMMWSFNSQSSNMAANDALKFHAGVSLSHVNKPKQSFSDYITKKLYSRISFHAGSFIGVANTNLSFVPGAVMHFQGPSREIVLGTLVRYRLQDASRYTNFVTETAIALGGYYRFGDAVIAVLQGEYRNFTLGLSYDLNTSALRKASSGLGGLEVSVKYVTPIFNTNKNKSMY